MFPSNQHAGMQVHKPCVNMGLACLQAKASACDQHQALEAQEARRGAGRDASSAGLGSMDWRVRLLPLASIISDACSEQCSCCIHAWTADLPANTDALKTLSYLQALHSVVRSVMRDTLSATRG